MGATCKKRINTFRINPILRGLAGAEGIEPSSMVLETTVLPLYYAPRRLGRLYTINLLRFG